MEKPLPAEVIAGDLPCMRCGYNLRTLSRAGVCPECATPVAASGAYAAASRRFVRHPGRIIAASALLIVLHLIALGFSGDFDRNALALPAGRRVLAPPPPMVRGAPTAQDMAEVLVFPVAVALLWRALDPGPRTRMGTFLQRAWGVTAVAAAGLTLLDIASVGWVGSLVWDIFRWVLPESATLWLYILRMIAMPALAVLSWVYFDRLARACHSTGMRVLTGLLFATAAAIFLALVGLEVVTAVFPAAGWMPSGAFRVAIYFGLAAALGVNLAFAAAYWPLVMRMVRRTQRRQEGAA